MRKILFRSARRNKERKTIGFYGVDSGVGTTHLALAAASYIVNEWGLPAAVVELADHPCIQNLNPDADMSGHFSVDGVGYFPQTISAQLPMLLNGAYPYLILDLGSGAGEWQEFLRCDLRYLVASLSPWRVHRAQSFFAARAQQPGMEQMYQNYFTALLTVTGNVYEKKKFQQTYHVPVRTVPFMADPFQLGKEQWSFFQELL